MSFVKEEVLELCRICESLENLLDTSTEDFSHLNEKLHKIADFEDKYSYWLKFICTSCSAKIESVFEFKTQCENTYNKIIDRIKSNTFDPLSNVCELPIAKNVKVEIFEAPVPENLTEKNNESNKICETPNKQKRQRKRKSKHNLTNSDSRDLSPVDRNLESEYKTQYSFVCAFCEWTFQQKHRLRDHIEGRHLKRKRYSCEICRKRFVFAPSRYRHRLIYHSDKTFPCDLCGKSFKTQMYLNKHKKRHSETREPQVRKHLCHLCGYKSKDVTHHVEHLNWHAGIKPFKCEECGKDFVRKDALRTHRKTHTDEKHCICQICSKAFRTNAQMRTHLTTHTGDKNFKCKYCSKSYSQIGGLHYHMRTHTGEKPFECPTCSKTFAAKHLLQRHIWIHTGEKPFECVNCSKTFRSKSNLQRHRKICFHDSEHQSRAQKSP